MVKSIYVGLVAAGMAVATVAGAQPEQRPYISLGGHYAFEDSDRASDPGIGFSVGVGQRLFQRFGLEIQGFSTRFDQDIAEWKEYGVEVDGHFYLNDSASFAPYLLAGVGYIRSQEETLNLDFDEAFGAVGVGAHWFPWSGTDTYNLGIRTEYKFRAFDTDFPGIGALNDHIVSLGLVMPLGAKSAPADASMVDSDGDGVPDDRDLCPGTPPGVAVDERGCPLDTDGDGVPDYLDKCPETAAGVVVNKEGCPVDAKGPNREFENITFAFDRSDLTDYARGILDAASQVITELSGQHAGLVVQIDGHTDSVGSPGYNQALSERRANTVKQYLVRKGVDARRVETRAFGLNKPIATNETEEGRAKNRRAEVRSLVR